MHTFDVVGSYMQAEMTAFAYNFEYILSHPYINQINFQKSFYGDMAEDGGTGLQSTQTRRADTATLLQFKQSTKVPSLGNFLMAVYLCHFSSYGIIGWLMKAQN